MVHPVLVDHAQHHHALELAHDGGGERLLLGVVEFFRGLDQTVGKLLLRKTGECARVHRAAREIHALAGTERLGGGLRRHLAVLAQRDGDVVFDARADKAEDGALDIKPVEHLLALTVDDLALLVHHVVVLEHGLARLEVAGLDARLRVFDGAREHLRVDGHVLGHVEAVHQIRDAFAAEQAHQVVVEGEVEARLAGVALTAGAAAKLVVDAAGVVALRADDEKAARLADLFSLAADLLAVFGEGIREHLPRVQDLLIVGVGVAGRLGDQLVAHARLAQVVAREVFRVAAEHDIGAAARHVRRHGDGAELARLRDDLGLLFVVLRVEQVVLDALALEEVRELFVLFDGHRADKHRLTLGVTFLDLLDDGAVLGVLGLIHDVGIVDARERAVGRDLDDVEVVDCAELLLLGQRRAGHAGELFVEAEVVLERDGGERFALARDGDALLGLDGLVQPLAVAAAEHEAARELVDNDDLAVLDDVVDVALHDAVRFERLVDVVRDGRVLGVGEVFEVKILLDLLHAARGQRRGLGLFIDDVVGLLVDVLLLLLVGLRDDLLAEARDEAFGAGIHLRGLLAHAGDDERRARLVDEDGVHLVDDDEGVPALHELVFKDCHVVAQVVEAHLVVRAVGDIRGVGLAALFAIEVVDDQSDGEAEEAVDLAHPLAVALGEVIVDRDDVHALARERVEVRREHGDKRLALAGLHFGDAPLMEHDAADELHAVGVEPDDAPRRLTDGRERLGQDVVERFAVLKALLELRRFGLKLRVAHRGVLVRHRLDLVGDGVDALELALAVGAEYFGEKPHGVELPFGVIHKRIPI